MSYSKGCAYMLYDMSNFELIDVLKREGWKIELRRPDRAEPWWEPTDDDLAEPENGGVDDSSACWEFRISKGRVSYTRATDLYLIANKAIYGGTR